MLGAEGFRSEQSIQWAETYVLKICDVQLIFEAVPFAPAIDLKIARLKVQVKVNVFYIKRHNN